MKNQGKRKRGLKDYRSRDWGSNAVSFEKRVALPEIFLATFYKASAVYPR